LPRTSHVIGYTTTLTASVVRQVTRHFDNLSIGTLLGGIEAAVTAMRGLFQYGYEFTEAKPAFPAGRLKSHLETFDHDPKEATPKRLSRINVSDLVSEGLEKDDRTILVLKADRERQSKSPPQSRRDAILEMAVGIVKSGPENAQALEGVPVEHIGKLYAVDRREIEDYRDIRALLVEYSMQIADSTRHRGDRRPHEPPKPLNLAVFGPPGSGKSFGIRQVATVVQHTGEDLDKLEFNLAQFDGPKALHGALHQVRDTRLKGKLPLVVWDEFDTKLRGMELGWLRYFLAPMQDGSFEQGEVTHFIGPCIFVFSGGICESRAAFESRGTVAEREMAKVPDFVSRLNDYLDILGPNPRDGNPDNDPAYLIRRAFLLRSLFRDHASRLLDNKDELSIDTDVLRALLLTKNYKHGVRSILAIITGSHLMGQRKFDKSNLPPESVLRLHVEDVQGFQNLVKGSVR
jgi:hypothetical protein